MTNACLDNDITHAELELWRDAYRRKGIEGLKSSELTALAQSAEGWQHDCQLRALSAAAGAR